MIHTIKITELSVREWVDFIDSNRYYRTKPKKLIVDFTKLYFLKPQMLVSVACLVEEYFIHGVEISFKRKKGSLIDKYLQNLRIFDYWKPHFDRSVYNQAKITSALALWKVSYDMIDMYTPYAQRYYQDNFLVEQDLTPLHIVLSEIMNNINDHSASTISGYSLTQYYPNTHELVIAICDFGVGIPTKINGYLKSNGEKPLPEGDALIKSFQRGYSTKSAPHNRGYGLDNILSTVNVTQGKIRTISNKAILWQNNEGLLVTNKMPKSFSGTMITITLNTQGLETIDKNYVDEYLIT